MATLTSLPAPGWLRDLAQARATYEETLGWPVTIQIGRRDLVVPVAGPLAAIGMPARLGARIRQALTIALLPAPIIADPSATWWTFLTRPVGTLRPDVTHDLTALRVRVIPRNTPIELPLSVTTSTPNTRRWVEPPLPTHPLPPGSVVV
ncbi:MAG TPA: hypothetical protein VGR06_09465, partial [Actinophytocola sp.]|uniref:hypothetical protein n=1 Tax=Actinophytocola sp. TaxID=1872138 RepID=UPI002E0C3983|nr:hypothetical protein [Actinophytocola sp.]